MANTRFYGNVEFYNKTAYKVANHLVHEAVALLQSLDMTEEEAYAWIKGWLYVADGD